MRTVLLAAVVGFVSIQVSFAGDRLRVLSYNVWGVPFAATDVHNRVSKIAEKIPVLAPEIVAFQEAFSGCFVQGVARDLLKGTAYPYFTRGPKAKGIQCVNSGVLILSKYPILARDEVVYQGCSSWDCVARKGAVYARIRVPNLGEVDVYATHTDSGEKFGAIRLRQIDQLIDFVRRNSGDGERPAIFMGDFNATPDSAEMLRFKNELGLRDSYAEYNEGSEDSVVRDGFTCDPKRNAILAARKSKRRQRIDYVFYREARTFSLGAQTAGSRMVFEENAERNRPLSDHFGVMSELDFTTPASFALAARQ